MLALCDRFHKLPSEILAEDASLFQMLAIVERGKPQHGEYY
jgi:hypothetical protein